MRRKRPLTRRAKRAYLHRPASVLRADSDKDIERMSEALELARQAGQADEVPVGAVLYRGDERIGIGLNTREAARDPLGHAEIQAISQATQALGDWRLNDCTLYVTLEPCPMCAGAIVNARLGRLVYGASDPKAGAVHTLYRLCTDHRLNHRVDVTAGVLAGECGAVLTEFFRARRRASRQAR